MLLIIGSIIWILVILLGYKICKSHIDNEIKRKCGKYGKNANLIEGRD